MPLIERETQAEARFGGRLVGEATAENLRKGEQAHTEREHRPVRNAEIGKGLAESVDRIE